ncbi:hypothetical protein BGZ80_006761, partial [Entomortierella chlamydospora]
SSGDDDGDDDGDGGDDDDDDKEGTLGGPEVLQGRTDNDKKEVKEWIDRYEKDANLPLAKV